MQHAINLVLSLIFTLFHLVVAAIATIEAVLRDALAPTGIGTTGENIVLLVVAVALIIGAVRLFGGIFALLIGIVLILLILHILVPGLRLEALGSRG